MYNRLDRIPSCDRQMDGQTDRQISCHGIVRAMHTRRAVKTLSVKFGDEAEASFFRPLRGMCIHQANLAGGVVYGSPYILGPNYCTF